MFLNHVWPRVQRNIETFGGDPGDSWGWYRQTGKLLVFIRSQLWSDISFTKDSKELLKNDLTHFIISYLILTLKMVPPVQPLSHSAIERSCDFIGSFFWRFLSAATRIKQTYVWWQVCSRKLVDTGQRLHAKCWLWLRCCKLVFSCTRNKAFQSISTTHLLATNHLLA